jgi:hypothetical protein
MTYVASFNSRQLIYTLRDIADIISLLNHFQEETKLLVRSVTITTSSMMP